MSYPVSHCSVSVRQVSSRPEKIIIFLLLVWRSCASSIV